jgi:hypothetical protein
VSDDSTHDPREEARRYLFAFLQQLQTTELTYRAGVAINQQILDQLRTGQQQQGVISAQLDGVAQRLDLLVDQLSALTNVLSGDEVEFPEIPVQPPRRRGGGRGFPSVGQALGGVVGYGVDQMMQGRSGGRRAR